MAGITRTPPWSEERDDLPSPPRTRKDPQHMTNNTSRTPAWSVCGLERREGAIGVELQRIEKDEWEITSSRYDDGDRIQSQAIELFQGDTAHAVARGNSILGDDADDEGSNDHG